MYGELIYISSLKHNDITDQFDNVIKKEKYSCFPLPDIKSIGANLYLLGMPFNKKIHWFIAQVISNDGKIAKVNVIDKDVLNGASASKVTTLSVKEKGLLDNIEYSFLSDVDRNNSNLKMITTIRKNTMGYYVFNHCFDNAFKITPTKSQARFN